MSEFTIDNIKYALNKKFDFSWLSEYGKVFRIFDCGVAGIHRLIDQLPKIKTLTYSLSQMVSPSGRNMLVKSLRRQ